MTFVLKRFVVFTISLLILAVCATAFAGKPASVENISYSISQTENGQDYLHIELTTNRPVENFSANLNPNNNNQLIFRLENAKLSHISRQENLDGTIGRKIFVQELDNNFLQGKLYTNSELTNKSYKIYAVPKTKQQKKNIIAIDIFPATNDKNKETIFVDNLKNKIITLDAGHGGSDSGAIGPTGYSEKEATLAITQNVADILSNSGAKILMTRDSDVDVYGVNASAINELQARVNVGNNSNSDLFISIHCNAFTNPSANGTQTFYYDGSYQGKKLATLIQKEMIEVNNLRDRGISTCNFYVVKHSAMPAVLIETAFITNPTEEALLSDPDWQSELAKAIARGISAYFN